MAVALACALGAPTLHSQSTPPNFGRLVIIGDSITQATGNSAAFAQNGSRGYRWHLFKKLVDAGATFDFVGSLNTNYVTDSQYPTWRGMAFDRANEGHYAWRAYEIRNGPDAARLGSNRGTGSITQWTDPALGGYVPDTVFMMIGINDTSTRSATAIRDDVAAIIDTIQSRNPSVRIFLSELLYSNNVNNSLVDTYNALLPALATSKTTATSTVTLVTMLNGQTGGWNATNMTYDNTHPNSRGEAYVAGRIADAMGLSSQWTAVTVNNANFEGGFTGAGTVSCAPNGWTIYGTPNSSAVPKQITDYAVVNESTVDNVPSGTGASGSSYVIAGTADTGIKQTLSETLTSGRRYILQLSAYAGSSSLTSGDWGVEVWAGSTQVGAADNKLKLNSYTTGTGFQIGSKLTELTVEFDAADFPSAQGQPLEIRLISRNNTRYVGFEDVRLSWKSSPVATPKHYKMYVLTGQSNSLGTDAGTEIDRLPGVDPADAEVPFWWANVADATVDVGSSNGFWSTLRAQPGYNYYANVTNAWGPEINFARNLYHAGERDFVVVKASRGGGGNTAWDKASAGHMYTQVVNTVTAACNRLTAEGSTYEIAGLLYLQGESNDSTEAAAAGTRFKTLVDNLRTDLPNAASLKGYMVGNIDSSADDATTRAQQEAIAADNPSYISYVDSLDMTDEFVADNLHHNRKAKLVNGARFAHSVLGKTARFDAAAGFAPVYGQQYANSSAGVTPLTGLTAVLTGNSPLLQGWSEEPALRDTLVASPSQSAGSVLDGTMQAWNITDESTTGSAYYYSRKLTATQTAALAASGWRYSLDARFTTGYAGAPSFFFQYGDASNRWIVWLQRTDTGALTALINGATVTLQATYDGAYHAFALRKTAAGSVEFAFDGTAIGTVTASAVDANLEAGVHFGTASAAGKACVNIAAANLTAADTASPAATIAATDPYCYETVKTTGQFTVSLWPAPAANTTVNLSWSGTATAGTDYATPAASVVIPAGQTSATVTVTGLNDAVTEGQETIVATIATGSGYTADKPSSATVNIDEYKPTVSIVATDASASETGDTGTFTLSRNLTDTSITVSLSTGGTATSGADFVALPTTVTFAVGQSSTTVTVTPIDDNLYERTPETVLLTIQSGSGYIVGTQSAAGVTISSNETNPSKANNTTALNLAGSWLGDAPSSTEIPVWNNTVTTANTVSLGAATTWGGITIGSGASAPGGNVTLTGAYNLTFNGPISLGDTRNLTIGATDGGTLSLLNAVLTGTTTLTINKTTDTAFTATTGAFNAANALAFNGTLALRGGTPSTAPGSMQGGSGRFWLMSQAGSQLAGTKFILDTGASASDGQDFIFADWNSSGTRTLTLAGLRGYGTIRTDAGTAGTRNLIVDQSIDTTFNGMLLAHNNGSSNRTFAFEKKGSGSLTMAGIVGYQGGTVSTLTVKVSAGTLVLGATNTYSGATTVSGGTLLVTGSTPSTTATTVASGARLGGTGTMNGTVTLGGILAPGTSGAGTLAIASTLDCANGSRLAWDLVANADATPGTQFDRATVTTLNIAAGATTSVDINLAASGSAVDFTNSFWRTTHTWSPFAATSRTGTGTFALGTVGTDSRGTSAARFGSFSVDASTGAITWTPAPYGNWIATQFGADAADPAKTDLQADPDGDGRPNLLEYFTNTPAATAGGSPIQLSTILDAGNRYAELTFPRNPDATDCTYAIERSADLLAWEPAAVSIIEETASLVHVRDTAPIPTGTPRFLRIRIALE